VGGEDRSRADLGRLLLPVPFVAQFSGEWVAVQAPLLRAGAGVFGDGGRRSMLARLALCFISAKGWEPFPAIVFLDGGGGQCMPVFTCCGDGRCAWEAIYSASSPSSKSSAVSTLWTSSLVQMAAIDDPRTWCGGCNFQFFKGSICTRVGLYCSLV